MRETILAQMPHALEDASSLALGTFYKGKVRDNFTRGDKRILVVSDRISAFDRLLGVIPFKGEVLTQISKFWFDATKHAVPNHLLDVPDPQVMIAREAKPIAIEMVVRARLTGSLWRDYQQSTKTAYGMTLPSGMKQYQAFAQPIITPSTKAEYGQHDEPTSPAELIQRGTCTDAEWQELSAKALQLFALGQKHAASRGLVLVDTKYEFGRVPEGIIAIDEVHTPDCSRYWYDDANVETAPRMLDKEFLRGWLLAQGFKGEGTPPHIPDSVRAELAEKYLELYTVLIGKPLEVHPGPVLERIRNRLKNLSV